MVEKEGRGQKMNLRGETVYASTEPFLRLQPYMCFLRIYSHTNLSQVHNWSGNVPKSGVGWYQGKCCHNL